MTAQASERIIIGGRPHTMFAAPLYRLAKHCRLDLANPNRRSTANYRGYVGTWEVRDRKLYLVHLNWDGWDGVSCEVPISADLRRRLLRAASSPGFPVFAHWYSGVARIPLGRRLVYSHFGWQSWYERERVIRFVHGHVVRDREVDTRAILEWWLRRQPEARDFLDPGREHQPLAPLVWFDDQGEEPADDWWPPDFVRP